MLSSTHAPNRLRAAAAAAILAFAPLPAALSAQLPGPDSVRSERSRQGMVVSEHPLASEAGRDVLAAGGNAVDAAIATGFALAVTHPAAGNIGGGGFMVIRFPDGHTTALDFREMAPAAAHAEMFVEDGEYSSRVHHDSHIAVGVPGTVAGLDTAHRLYGSLNWERLVYPAVALADDGFELSERLARSIGGFAQRSPYPTTVAAFSRAGEPYAAGEIFQQPDLARTLTRIMLERRDGFYRGETARLIAEEMRRGGGMITEDDLATYQVRERAPVLGSYRGYDVISMAPPSSGGVALVQMLNLLEEYDLSSLGHNSAPYAHRLAEAMRLAYRDRARHLADADFADVPVHRLTSRAYADELRSSIDLSRAGVSSVDDVAAATATSYESPETTHYSVVDADGMAVSVTYTLEQSYGSGITVAGAGFLLNNEMGDFNARPGLTTEGGLIGTEPNLARPRQRMLSSMTPTILARDGELVAVIGSPGGRTIINTVLQLVLAHVDFRMTPEETIAAGRLHHQWLPDRLSAEGGALSEDAVRALEAMGHTVQMQGTRGLAHSIFIDPVTGERVGVPDPRNPDARAAGG
jgi:gamma-glutamyltranspeptidase/glutathione hydrolase